MDFGYFGHFWPVTGSKTIPTYLYLVEEVLSFDVVGYM